MLSTSIENTNALAKRFVETISKAQTGAIVVGLQGELGSGKTTFVKAVANVFGVTDTVTSPTFVIEKIYKLDPVIARHFTHLVHIDAYRLDGAEELVAIGWEEVSKNPGNLILIEWPERVIEALPKGTRSIHFSFVNETTRDIKLPDDNDD